MIQRIQSIFLLLVALCLACTFFVDIAQVGEATLSVHGIEAPETISVAPFLPFPLSAMVIGLVLLTLFVLFSFKNRKRQLLLGRLNYLLILVFIVLTFLSISDLQKELNDINANPYLWGAYLPIISLGLHLLANRAIKRDEELVKSLDRLR
jgi:hypothetical protein